MGRSVSSPCGATTVVYRTLEPTGWEDEDGTHNEPTDLDYQWEFEGIVEDLQRHAAELWPSFEKCDKWVDREDHAVLMNSHAYLGVSEYCGMVALWVLPRTEEHDWYPTANLCEAWCHQIAPKFTKAFAAYRKVAVFSNGEAFFEKVA